MTESRHAQFGIIVILICFLVCILFSSCTPFTPQEAFSSRLKKIDTAILSGKKEQARKNLITMRKNASSASQWLSLVKRERSLGLYEQSVFTLKEALVQLPANDSLAAVLTDTLMHLDRCDESIIYATPLLNTPFKAVAAQVGVHVLAKQGLSAPVDPRFCTAAYRATGNSRFITYAAMLHAKQGEYVAACDLLLSTVGSQYKEFTAILCYDATLYDTVLSLYDECFDYETCTPSELLLLADSYFRIGDSSSARSIWTYLTEKYSLYSPIPSYNLSRTEKNELSNAKTLTQCLEVFPTYFPALALYSHRARTMPPVATEDAITQKLREKGFTSTIMNTSLQRELYSQKEALELIGRARATPSLAKDPRYSIEAIRLNSSIQGPKERTDSMVWKLLEEHPEQCIVYDFALWYFVQTAAYDVSFSLNAMHPCGPIPFYSGLEAALCGDLDAAIKSFMKMANDDGSAWIGVANTALIHSRLGEKVLALEQLTTAASLAPDNRTESGIQYQIGLILESTRSFERAKSVLGYALDLDPENHLARSLLGKIRGLQ